MLCAGIPWSDVNLQSLKGTPPQWSADSSLSEVTSLTLEYYTLGQAMGEALAHPCCCEKKISNGSVKCDESLLLHTGHQACMGQGYAHVALMQPNSESN